MPTVHRHRNTVPSLAGRVGDIIYPVDYIASGEITNITPDAITFEDNIFYVPSSVTEFSFEDGGLFKTIYYDGSEWTVSDDVTNTYIGLVQADGGEVASFKTTDEYIVQLQDDGIYDSIDFLTHKSNLGYKIVSEEVTKLYSLKRDNAAMMTLFEPHVYFEDENNGYMMFDDTLANITSTIADKYVAEGMFVGFLNDNSDDAQAYAVPNASFRAFIRAKATAIDTLQKMIDKADLYLEATSVGLTGTLADCNLHYFRKTPRFDFENNNLTGSLPYELGNLKQASWFYLYGNRFTGSLPRSFKNLTTLARLRIDNQIAYKFTGVVPREFGQMVNLEQLILNYQSFTGWEQGAISTAQTKLNVINFESSFFSKDTIDDFYTDILASVAVNSRAGTLTCPTPYLPSLTGMQAFNSLRDTYGWTVSFYLQTTALTHDFEFTGTDFIGTIKTQGVANTVEVDYGDGNVIEYGGSEDIDISHTYAVLGTYDISISNPHHITKFDISGQTGLDISSPRKIFVNLSSVVEIDVSDTDIAGSLNDAFHFNYWVEDINMSNTDITGTLVHFELKPTPSLKVLDLSSTAVGGSVAYLDETITLEELYIQSTVISGGWSDLGTLVNLKILSSALNNITGDIAGLVDCASLEQVYLGSETIQSDITGDISVFSDKNITHLDLYSTSTEGNFEDILSGNLVLLNLKNISSLSGSVNGFINEPNLIELNIGSLNPNPNITGYLSTFVGLTGLEVLGLDNAAITGNISSLSALTNLRELILNTVTGVSGDIAVFSGHTQMEWMELTATGCTGDIGDLAALTSLWDLDVSLTEIGGDIAVLSNFTNLEVIRCNRNNAYGDIEAVKDLTSLRFFLIYGNDAEGDISDLALLTSLHTIRITDTVITGDIAVCTNFPILNRFMSENCAGIYGDLSAFNGLTELYRVQVSGTAVSGDIASLNTMLDSSDFIDLQDSDIDTYTSTTLPAWSLEINISNLGLSTTEIDNFLIDLNTAGGSNGELTISGNSARSSSSDVAYAALISRGWTITSTSLELYLKDAQGNNILDAQGNPIPVGPII